MVNASSNPEEYDFFKKVEYQALEKVKNLNQSLNIAVIGKVSAGKSSLINALLKRERHNAICKVGAVSGVNTKIQFIQLMDRVNIVDTPGLSDVKAENSQISKQFLSHIDVGILVLSGSSDSDQKQYLDELRQVCDSIFIVLNKIDQYENLAPQALEDVINQWKGALGVNKIYPVCVFGYDPQTRKEIPLNIKGVDELREDIEDFLAKKGKDLLLARLMNNTKPYAVKIILTALLSVIPAAFVPGSAVSVTTIQVVAISSLYYLYKGEVLPIDSVWVTMMAFLSQAGASSLFILISSFFPPNGVIDIVTATVAVTTTLSMLLAVNSLLSKGAELKNREILQNEFKQFKPKVKEALNQYSIKDLAKKPSILKQMIEWLIG